MGELNQHNSPVLVFLALKRETLQNLVNFLGKNPFSAISAENLGSQPFDAILVQFSGGYSISIIASQQ